MSLLGRLVALERWRGPCEAGCDAAQIIAVRRRPGATKEEVAAQLPPIEYVCHACGRERIVRIYVREGDA